ncbi:hypothetical protein H1C71_006053 [Ictidomys tridecemlineatus]|nr:hypothetical protein H1C71_006053 [Ictidomys tridecemlineatus]
MSGCWASVMPSLGRGRLAPSLTTWPGWVLSRFYWAGKGVRFFSVLMPVRTGTGPPPTLSFDGFYLFSGFGTRQTAEKGQRGGEDSLSFKNDQELHWPLLPAPPELPDPGSCLA